MDALLLQQLRNDQSREAAFQELISKHYAPVKMLAYSMTRDFQTAEDIAQEVFAGFWRKKIFMTTEIQSFSGYLMTVCRNTCLDFLEAREKEKQRQQELQTVIKTHEEPNYFSKDDTVRRLAALTSQERRVVQLVYLDGLSHAEAAATLGLALGTVRTHLKNAMRSLRSQFRRK